MFLIILSLPSPKAIASMIRLPPSDWDLTIFAALALNVRRRLMLLSAAHMSIHVSILMLPDIELNKILKTFKSSVVIITRPTTTKIDANNPRLPRGFLPKNVYECAILNTISPFVSPAVVEASVY
jgi:hypothetical protein